MSFKEEYYPHSYVYVLKEGEIRPAFKAESKGLFKKKLQLVEYSNTIELINDGISKYGNDYVGTFDRFYFDKPEFTLLMSKTSYDELVKTYRWRHERNMEQAGDYDYMMYYGKRISNHSVLNKKIAHIRSELSTMYPFTKNSSDPDYEKDKNYKIQFGPPSELIGPNGKPFGDFKLRLIYDNILFQMYSLYWSSSKKYVKESKPLLFKSLEHYENFTKLPAFEMDKLSKIIEIIRKKSE